MSLSPKRRADVRRAAEQIVKDIREKPDFARQVRADPVGTLYTAGLPFSAVGPFLKLSGFPGLSAGFNPRTNAHFEAAVAVDTVADWFSENCIWFCSDVGPETTISDGCEPGGDIRKILRFDRLAIRHPRIAEGGETSDRINPEVPEE